MQFNRYVVEQKPKKQVSMKVLEEYTEKPNYRWNKTKEFEQDKSQSDKKYV